MTDKVHAVNIAGESKPYHHGNLRAAIVEAGIAALAEGEEIAVRDLARRIGVSPNAAYRHFSSKETLLAAIAAEGFRRFKADLVAAELPHGDERTKFVETGIAYVRFARKHPALFRLMFGRMSATSQSAELHEATVAAFENLRGHVAATAAGPILAPQIIERAIFAWALAHGLSYLALDGRLDEFVPRDGSVEGLIQSVIDMTGREGLAPKTAM